MAKETKRIEAEKALRRAALNYAGANARYAAEWKRQNGDNYKQGPLDELTEIACVESNHAQEALTEAAKALYAAVAAKEEVEQSSEDRAEMLAELPL